MQEFRAGASDAGKRTDAFVSEQYSQFTRSALRGLFNQSLVSVNGKAGSAGDKLKAGDVIKVNTELIDKAPTSIQLPVIYEDGDVVVVNKPAGVLTHSKGALNLEPSVATFIRSKIADPALGGNRAGIVHRLDRPTSGVIVCAKNVSALKFLQKQFSTRKAVKTYLALVRGEVSLKKAVIDVPIGRNPKSPQTFRAGLDGKGAQTSYETMKVFQKDGQTYSLLKLTPYTGRTHQIRVHLSYIKHPVVGDQLYGADDDMPMLLHAAAIQINLPSGHIQTFNAPLPPGFANFMPQTQKG